jgi:hypothetical protein
MAANFNVTLDKNFSPTLWVSMVKQFGWNDKSGKGSFKQNMDNREKTINVKFTALETAGIIKAFKEKSNFKAYHDSPSSKVSIMLTFTEKEYKGEKMEGFFFSLTRNSTEKFNLPLGRDTEGYALACYLEAEAFVAPALAKILSGKPEKKTEKPNAEKESEEDFKTNPLKSGDGEDSEAFFD